MRLPIGLAAIALLGLLGGSVGASTALAPQSASNAADPAAAEPPAETSAVMNMSVGSEHFTSEVSACVSDAPGHLPDGTDANAFCACKVEKVMTDDMRERDAIFQCAAVMHINGPAFRAGEISECVSGSPGILPDGADANAFCTCAVDKMLTTSTLQLDAVHQCATTMHLTLRNLD